MKKKRKIILVIGGLLAFVIAAQLNGQRQKDAEGFLCMWIVSARHVDGWWIEAPDRIAVNE